MFGPILTGRGYRPAFTPRQSRSTEKRAGLLSGELVVDRVDRGGVWLFHVLLVFPRKCEDARARSVMHEASKAAVASP
jgi:hypothetical protein